MKQPAIVVAALLAVLVGVSAYVLRPRGRDGGDGEGGDVITLRGAVQFGESHAFTRTIRKFDDIVADAVDDIRSGVLVRPTLAEFRSRYSVGDQRGRKLLNELLRRRLVDRVGTDRFAVAI